jgi:hypothetical protein
MGRASRLAGVTSVALIQAFALWMCEPPILGAPGRSGSSGQTSVSYTHPKVAGVWTHVVTVNLNDAAVRMDVVLAAGGPGTSEKFSSIVQRTRPVAALTGTYFDLRTFVPVGDLVCEGRPVFTGRVGNALAIAPGNRASIVHGRRGGAPEWEGYEAVLGGGPTLVRSGAISVNPSAEGFRDGGHYRPRPRTAVGLRANNKLLMVVVTRRVTLSRLARVMKALGAVDAMALDGGTSAALYYKGKTIVQPGRRLTNILAVYGEHPQPTQIASADVSGGPELICEYEPDAFPAPL